MAGGIAPGPQSKSSIMPKNHLYPRNCLPFGSVADTKHTFRMLGKHFFRWGSSYGVAMAATGLFVVSCTEWKAVLQYVPIINLKFKNQE